MSLDGLFALGAGIESPRGAQARSAQTPSQEPEKIEGASFLNQLAASLLGEVPAAAGTGSAVLPTIAKDGLQDVPTPQAAIAEVAADSQLQAPFGKVPPAFAEALKSATEEAEGLKVDGEAVAGGKAPDGQPTEKGDLLRLFETRTPAKPDPTADRVASRRAADAEAFRLTAHPTLKEQAVPQRFIATPPLPSQADPVKAQREHPAGSSEAGQTRAFSGDQSPRVDLQTDSQESSDFDSSRQRQDAVRTASTQASAPQPTQAAAQGRRFAELLQAQKAVQQSSVASPTSASMHEAQRTAAQHAAAETAGLRGQQADHVFNQVVQNARLLRFEDGTRFEIRLKPEFLGRIQIETRMGADQVMTTRFMVEDPQVRTLLEHRLPLLTERLGEHGIRMQSVEVHSMTSQSGYDSGRPDTGAGGRYPHSQKGSGRSPAGTANGPPGTDDSQSRRPLGSGLGRIHLVA